MSGHASVTVAICFNLVERSWSAQRKEPQRAGTDKPKQAALKLEGYTASSAQLNFTLNDWLYIYIALS